MATKPPTSEVPGDESDEGNLRISDWLGMFENVQKHPRNPCFVVQD